MSPATSTPSIRVYDPAAAHRSAPLPHHRSVPHPRQSGAMSIPRARDDNVPPPLPPPRYIGEKLNGANDVGWQWGNANSVGSGSIKPGSSLLGGQLHRAASKSLDDMSSDSHDGHSDEDRARSRPTLAGHRFSSERQLGQKALETSSQAYDNKLLSMIGETSSQAYDNKLLSMIGGPNSSTPNTPTRTTVPRLSVSAQDSASTARRHNGELQPLSVPDRLHQPPNDSPSMRWPPSAAHSPAYSGFRSPRVSENDAHARRFGSVSTVGTLEDHLPLHRGSYDHNMLSDSDFAMEDGGMRNLNLNDRSPAYQEDYYQGNKGQKRRASSPPSEAARADRPTGSGNVDLYHPHRRSAQKFAGRNSPVVARFHSHQGSLHSASPLSQRNASFSSSFAFSGASSMTSYNGDERLSPGALSPTAEVECGPVSPYAANRSLNPSPRGSLSRLHRGAGSLPEHETSTIRKMSTDNVLLPRQTPMHNTHLTSGYTCDCCVKKPKKFDTEDELRIHRAEKQYACEYCPNRFKNKNEAERHMNSLHVRKNSWSCAALKDVGVSAAFHPSPVHAAVTDVCGYCGEEFPNPPDWESRSYHVNHVHKFGECNQGKKFYRADHFRQHLKHSHAGTSGKWTNMLENACMKDEPPPNERAVSAGTTGSSSAPNSTISKADLMDDAHD